MKDERSFFKFTDLDNCHVVYVVEKTMSSALGMLAGLSLEDCEFIIIKKISLDDAKNVTVKDDDSAATLAEAELGSKFSNLA